MIEVQAVEKRFGQVVAVRDLSFTAADGVITGLLGENGAGKTTTLGMMCGAIPPDAGSIWIDKTLVCDEPYKTRRRVGTLLEHRGLYARLTARENISYFGALHGLPHALRQARVSEILALLELNEIADRRVDGFSQGQRMKVALGRALLHAPQNVLLDEPTNGLDISSVRGLRDLLRRMRDHGACIVFSSHVLDEVRLLCDTVIILSKGVLVAKGSTGDICRWTQSASLEDAFVALTRDSTDPLCQPAG